MMPRLRETARFAFLPVAGLFLCAPALFAQYTVRGRFLYEDRAYNVGGFTGAIQLRPIRFADVRIVDAGGKTLASGATGSDGAFAISVPGSPGQSIRAVCLASSTASGDLRMEIRVANWDFSFGGIWSFQSDPVTGSQLGDIIARSNTESGSVFNIWDVLYDGMEFAASSDAAGRLPGELLSVLWNPYHSTTASFYSSTPRRFAYIGSRSGYDDPVICHHFANFVLDVFSKLGAPFASPAFGDAGQDIRVAWAQGASMFVGASIRRFKKYDRPDLYLITDGSRAVFSMEIESLTSPYVLASTKGSTNAIAVCAALWDITDSAETNDSTPGTDDDPLARWFYDVWRVLTQYMPNVARAAVSAEDFWDGWFSAGIDNGFPSEMRTIFADLNGIEFFADQQESDDSAATASTLQPARASPASGPKVVINEVDLGIVNTIELFNAGDADADLTGWIVTATRAGHVTALLELPSFRLKAGRFVILSEAAGVNSEKTLYFAVNIPWFPGAEGACALRDSNGMGKDFVRWGDSREFPPGGTAFTGANPPSPPWGKTLGRNLNGTDTDSGGDWTVQVPSPGSFNVSGQEKRHTFYPEGDVDYTAFEALGGRSYLVESLNLANGADTVLEILAGDGGTVLATSDDHGPTKASRIVWTAPSSGRFYLRARRYVGPTNHARYGSYDLRIIESAGPLASVAPQILTVSKPGQGGRYPTIGDALSAADNGDIVQIIDSGTYQENLTVTDKSVTLRVAAGKQPVLDGRGRNVQATLVIRGVKTATVDGFTILGGLRGLYLSTGAFKILNTIVVRTSGATDSDGIQVIGADTTAQIIHCTIANNARAGVAVFERAAVRVVNSIVRNNGVVDIGGDAQTAASLTVRNSIVSRWSLGYEGFAGKHNNIGDDPRFVNAAADDYRLQGGSPAIDKGDPNEPGLPLTDAAGLPRSLDGNGDGFALPDMGAYEYMTDSSLTVTAVFPQIAVGGPSGAEYRTSVVVVNTGAQAAAVKTSLTRSDGAPLHVTASGGGGSSFNMVLAPSGTARLETTATGDTQAGYAKLMSNVIVSGTALFKWMKGSEVLSEAGVGLSRPTRRFRVYIDNMNNAFSGYAVANAGVLPANLVLTLRNREGEPVQTKNLQLEPGTHMAKFAHESDQFGPAAGAGFEGSIEFTSDRDVAAVALRYDNETNPVFSTIPVLVDEAATILYFPQVADGGGYRTNFILMNPANAATTARLEFYASDGSPLSLPVAGQPRTSWELSLKANGVTHVFTDGTSAGIKVGWVRVISPLPIGGSAIFQVVAGNRIFSQAGVASSPLAERFTTYVESLGWTDSGLAICNPNNNAVTITLNLRDTAGNVADSKVFTLPARGHIARFFSGPGQWFPTGYDEFEGTLEVISTGGPVSGVALRYDNERDRVFATLPVIVIP